LLKCSQNPLHNSKNHFSNSNTYKTSTSWLKISLGNILVKTLFDLFALMLFKAIKHFDLPNVGHDLPKVELKGHLDLHISSCYFKQCKTIIQYVNVVHNHTGTYLDICLVQGIIYIIRRICLCHSIVSTLNNFKYHFSTIETLTT